MRLYSLRPGFPLICLSVLLSVLLLAGGSSRADAAGQALIRGVCWGLVIVWLLIGPRPARPELNPIAGLLTAILLLALAQLVPLPPAWWQALPGRELAAEASRLAQIEQPWRPISLVPGATINAVGSLIVPFATLLCVAGLDEPGRRRVFDLVLAVILVATLVGLAQFSGTLAGNLLLKDIDTQASGTFSNRNHFALLLVLGCLLAPVWVARGERRLGLRASVALGLLLLLLLTILAIGSRAGLGLALPALMIGMWLARGPVVGAFRGLPRWVGPSLFAGAIVLIGVFILFSIASDRAMALDRIFAIDLGGDMRAQGLPVVLAMIRTYFPVGTGLGSFDPMFRVHEPFELLNPRYFNHAHNDFLELVLDAGLPGLLLILAALGWWGRASFRVWRAPSSPDTMLARLGSAMLFFLLVASAFDYPARTPLIMTIAVIAGTWLAAPGRRASGSF